MTLPNDDVASTASSPDENRCVDGVCPLKPRSKPPPAAAAAVPDENGCVDGVCPFKPKSKQQAASKAAEEEEEEQLARLAIGDAFPSTIQFMSLLEGSSDEMMSIDQLRGGKVAVLDFWSTTCVRCPASMTKLNGQAAADGAAHNDVMYATINIYDRTLAAKMVQEGGYVNLQHYSIDETTKEKVKQLLGMTAVPFLLVLDGDGHVQQMGSPKQVNLDHLPSIPSSAPPAAAATSSSSSDSTASPSLASSLKAFDLNADF